METQCPHCQAIVKVPDGIAGKEFNCLKCNQPFIVSPQIEDNTAEACSNCNKQIEKLEQACVFNDRIVCTECDKELRSNLKLSDSATIDITALEESGSKLNDEVIDAAVCEILNVGDPVVASEDSAPESFSDDGNDIDMVKCGNCGKQMRKEDKADGCESLDVTLCRDCGKEISSLVASVERKANSPYSALGGPVGVVVFVLMVFIGGPMLKSCWSELSHKTRKPSRTKAILLINSLPADGIYNDPNSRGNYKDPVNGYFEVQPPVGFQIKERRDKSKFTVTAGSSHVGEIVPQSFIQFISTNKKAFIVIIARKTFVTIEQDFESLLANFPKKFPGIKISRSRVITIDGVKGIEIIGSLRGQKLFAVKYKKHGLDHSITMNCDIADFQNLENEITKLLCSYRSLNPGRN
jgi:hypothetical protein